MKIIYKGLFLDEKSTNLLLAKKALVNGINKMHITFEFGPKEPFPDNIIGKEYNVKVIAEGNNGKNHAFKVELPEELKQYYKNDCEPHITVSLSDINEKPYNSRYLKYDKIEEFYVNCYLDHYIN